ncbi:MAG: efflux RND transporter permease subunit, partial [Candidatus Theseobacter exili]|nr:efflux RND transporter permease subunit [Candidatus Theseobacter exili]
ELLRPKVKDIGEAERAFVYFSEERGGGSKELLIDVYGYDYKVLKKIATGIAGKLEQVKGLTDIKLRMKEGRPEMQIVVDKQDARLHNLSVREIADSLHAQMRGLEATRFHSGKKEIDTIARLQKKDRAHLTDVRRLTVVSPKNELVELKQVVDFKFGIGPSEIWRKNKTRMIQVSANLSKITLDIAVKKVKEQVKDIEFPKDYFYLFGGDYEKMQENQRQLRFALFVTLLLIYMVLASLFESYSQPIIIMVSVPLAAIGAAIGLFLSKSTISMGVMIGAIMLGGIVVNNAIVLLDYTNQLARDLNMNRFKAILKSGTDRLRPICMTTATTVLGLLPMALDRSQGASLWSPLAITVIGGLLSSTVLTLFVVPSFYIIFTDFGRLFSRRRSTVVPIIPETQE